ncbi:tetratricopeptide repeat protein [Candidatus Aerophobetes bacterium]|nr:tetratricopeptide repeat protein [Candidatus Aerophobetes bacterium]
MRKYFFIGLWLLFVISPKFTFSKVITITKTAKYCCGDNESKLDGEKMALEKAKRLCLERAGVYLESTTVIEKGICTKDEIRTLSAGILKVEVVDKKVSLIEENICVQVTVRVEIDEEDVERKIKLLLRKEQIKQELIKIKKQRDALERKVSQLQNQLKQALTNKKKKKIIVQRRRILNKISARDLAMQTYLLFMQGKNDIVIEICKMAINADPEFYEPYLMLNLVYRRIGKRRNALRMCEKALDICQRKNIKDGLCNTYNHIGSLYNEWGKYRKAIEYYQKSLAICVEIDDLARMAESYHGIGNAYMRWGKYNEAIEYIQKSITLRKKVGDRIGLSASYDSIGIAYVLSGKYYKAIEYLEKSLVIRKGLKDLTGLGQCYFGIGLAYEYLGKYNKALGYIKKSIVLRKKVGSKIELGRSYMHMGLLYGYLGKPDRAIEYYKKSLTIAKEVNDREGLIGIYYQMAGYYFNYLRDKEKAIRYLKLSIEICRQLNCPYLKSFEKLLKTLMEY